MMIPMKWKKVTDELPKLKNYESSEINSCPEDMTVVIARYADGEIFPAYVYYSGMYVDNGDKEWDDFIPAEELIYNETVFFGDLREDSGCNTCEITHWIELPPFVEEA